MCMCRYESAVVDAQRVSRLNTLILSVVVGVMYFLVFGTCALAFWLVFEAIVNNHQCVSFVLICYVCCA